MQNFDQEVRESMEVGPVHSNRPCKARLSGRLRSIALPWNSAYELASTQGKPPGIMRGARDTDSRIGHNVHRRTGVSGKTVIGCRVKVDILVVTNDRKHR